MPGSFGIQYPALALHRGHRSTNKRETKVDHDRAQSGKRVANAPLIVLILGDLNGHKKLEGILDETVHAGLLPREVADVWFFGPHASWGFLSSPF